MESFKNMWCQPNSIQDDTAFESSSEKQIFKICYEFQICMLKLEMNIYKQNSHSKIKKELEEAT